ncbi:AGAP013041-PA-like protein [Anopheles sinensis]|uniref:AGAP013041-PA-like protein n=1 Tax=Anopheles sinensis TaxID=74873 RepID=A0A084W9T4_ANOSI|nr:AGAP013041-PA-like protein [Anopheles sinensis]
MNERATSRLAVSEPTVCRRNPADPGPGHYETEPVASFRRGTEGGRRKVRQVCCGYTYDRYRREPFFRPPPGRYDLRPPLLPLPPARPCHDRDRIRIPVAVAYVGQLRRPATLRLNSINIPVRPRKGRRNRKVAFLSGSARFRDREFFPIGGLGSRTTSAGEQRRAAGTSKGPPSVAGQRVEWKAGESRQDGGKRCNVSTGSSIEGIMEAKLAEHIVKEWEAGDGGWQILGGISRLNPPSAKNKIPTRFFTIPSRANG